MKYIRIFLTENFHFLVVKLSEYLNWPVFVMRNKNVGTSVLLIVY